MGNWRHEKRPTVYVYYRIISDRLVGDDKRRVSARQAVPYSVFITSPLSNVGLTEKECPIPVI